MKNINMEMIDTFKDWANNLVAEYEAADNNGCLAIFADRAKDFIDNFLKYADEL